MRSILLSLSLWLSLGAGMAGSFAAEEPASTPREEPAAPTPLSKKERILAEKQRRPEVRARHALAAGTVAHRAVSLHNVWTKEVLPIEIPAPPPGTAGPRPALPAPRGALTPLPAVPPSLVINRFFRDHFTNQATNMDPRLVRAVLQAATRFGADVVEVVSAYRSPKYNLMLRKKGHSVARESQHPLGQAVDFRLPGLKTKLLYGFVRSLRLGGVGLYPHSEFVHADVGPIRFWKGS